MKKIQLVAGSLAVLMIFVTSGCGSLNRSISFDKLSNADMEYGQSIDHGLVDLRITLFDETDFETHQSASKAFILPPIVYMRSFGYNDGDYGQLRMLFLWPIFMNMRGAAYNSLGDTTANISGTMVSPIFGYIRGNSEQNNVNATSVIIVPIPIIGGHLYNQTFGDLSHKTNCHRFEFLRLPLIGPMFAFGNVGHRRFLWIPYGQNDTDEE